MNRLSPISILTLLLVACDDTDEDAREYLRAGAGRRPLVWLNQRTPA